MDPINVDLFIKNFLHSTWPPTEVCVQFPINIITKMRIKIVLEMTVPPPLVQGGS